jgi:hypothetical protein
MTPTEFEHRLISVKREIILLHQMMPRDTPFCAVPARMLHAARTLGECLDEFKAVWERGKIIPRPDERKADEQQDNSSR